jgi:hypothetical protein
MSTVDDLFRRFESTPYELAARLCRQLPRDQEEWPSAAIRWCSLASTSAKPEVQDREQTYDLLMAASREHGVFQKLLGEARQAGENYRGEPFFNYAPQLLDAMLWLWPARESPTQYPAKLREWAWSFTARPMLAHIPLTLAELLCGFPEIAYSLLEYPPIARCAHEVAGDPMLARASLALLRMRLRCPPDPRDDNALVQPSAKQYLASRQLLSRLRDVLAHGQDIPAHVWPEVECVLAGPRELEWYCAVALLAAAEPRQAEAVQHMADHLRAHTCPTRALELLSGHVAEVGSPFSGRGWSRKTLGRKLLPLSRVLLKRGIWPTAAWLRCVSSDTEDPKTTAEERLDHSFELVKSIFGEALLERALDPAEPMMSRQQAIAAIGLLEPGGDEKSLIRALGKLRHDVELGASAKQVQREHRDRCRHGRTDPEMCLLDALEHVSLNSSHAKRAY